MSPKIYLADLTYTQQSLSSDAMPAAIGCVATFCEARLGFEQPIRLFKYPEKLIDALESESPPDIIGFSNYVWNSTLSYAFARVIRSLMPRTVIVFGGPNYPTEEDEQKAYLLARPDLDFFVVKEGEAAFARLVRALVETDMEVEAVKRRDLPSIHCIDGDGKAHLSGPGERLLDLTEIPSPYVTGHMDPFFDGVLMPIIQTNRGCPFRCTYCAEGTAYYNKVRRNRQEKIERELEIIASKMARLRGKGGRQDLFIADSNFGMYREDLDVCAAIADKQKRYSWPEYISAATGKNQKERVLTAAEMVGGIMRLAGSVQSLNPEVLANIKRDNISFDVMIEMALKATQLGANAYSEVILALPGETIQSHFDTISRLMDAGFPSVVLYTLMIINGSDMATRESREKFGMKTMYRVLPRSFGSYRLGGREVTAVEIEQVCVATRTMSFDDYVTSRRMHLIINIFYNDAIFGIVIKLLRHLEIPIFLWMESLLASPLSDGLRKLFASFEEATCGELWDDPAALEEFIARPGTLESYLKGEIGYNLIFVHKALALTRLGSDLVGLARESVGRLLCSHGKDTPEVMAFLEDALTFHHFRFVGLFEDLDACPEAPVTHDVIAADKAVSLNRISDHRLDRPSRIRFALDQTQKEHIRTFTHLYGTTPVGIGRILGKIHVRRLFRHPVFLPPSD